MNATTSRPKADGYHHGGLSAGMASLRLSHLFGAVAERAAGEVARSFAGNLPSHARVETHSVHHRMTAAISTAARKFRASLS